MTEATLEEALFRCWGSRVFRNCQKEAILSTLRGDDVLVVLPTGGGKSLIYSLPAVVTRKTTVVVSPLISLAKDQLDSANDRDIEAASWSSTVSNESKKKIASELACEDSSLRLLFTTPESLMTERLMDILSFAHESGSLCSLAIDEA